MKAHFPCGTNLLCVALSFLIVFQLLPPLAYAQTLPTRLEVVVVEGEGAINNVRQRVTREPLVRVEDENHKPVVGAVVVFTLPTEGATGEFGNGAKTLTVVTNDRGEAKAQGLRLNRTNGKLPIHVAASYRGLATRTIINQINEGGVATATASGGGHGALIAILVIVGAAAGGGGAYLASRGSGSSSSTGPIGPTGPTPIGITAGTGSIAGGH